MRFLREILSNQKGSAMVEFALVVPLFVAVMGGIYDLTSLGMVNSKVTRISGTISDMVSRHDLTQTQLRAIMGTAHQMARPYNFAGGAGEVIVTQVTNDGETSDPDNMIISWQESLGDGTSLFGTPGNFPVNLPGGITVIDDQSMILVEVSFIYTPVFLESVLGSQTLTSTSVFVPRLSKMDTLLEE